jgi:hypothetical protein
MKRDYSMRMFFLLALIFFIGLHSQLRHLKEEVSIYRSSGTHEVYLLEKRLKEVKKELSSERFIGCITDENLKFVPYVLAPLIIIDYRKAKFVVAISNNASGNMESYKSKGLSLIKDFHNGVMLLGRKAE